MIIGGVSWSEVNTGKWSLSQATCTKHWRYPALDDDWCRPCLPRETGDWLMFLVQAFEIKGIWKQMYMLILDHYNATKSTRFLQLIMKTEMQMSSESQRGWGTPSVNPPPESNSPRGAGTGCVSQLLPDSDKRKQGNTFQASLSRRFSVCSPGQIKSIISRNKWLWDDDRRRDGVQCFWKNWQSLQDFSANVLIKHHSPIPALNQNFLSSTGLIYTCISAPAATLWCVIYGISSLKGNDQYCFMIISHTGNGHGNW